MYNSLKLIRVRPVSGGWMLDSDLTDLALMFRSGGAAERKAHQLAHLARRQGDMAQVVIYDRSGVVLGSFRTGVGGQPA